jgi:hypothetical protein
MLVCRAKRDAVRYAVNRQNGVTNIFFMGNSQIMAGIVPKKFDEMTGGKTFSWNLALPALPIAPHYFELRDYLAANKAPDIIILNVTPFSSPPYALFPRYAVQGADGFGEIFSYFQNQSDTTVLWNYLFPVRLYGTKFLEYSIDLTFNRHQVDAMREKNDAIIAQMLKDRGYYCIRDTALADDYQDSPEIAASVKSDKLLFDQDPYIPLFFNLAQQNHIRILLIEPPLPPHRTTNRTDLGAQYKKLMREYPATVFAAPEGWNIPRYPEKLFGDPMHLNRAGAAQFTAAVEAQFISVFGNK